MATSGYAPPRAFIHAHRTFDLGASGYSVQSSNEESVTAKDAFALLQRGTDLETYLRGAPSGESWRKIVSRCFDSASRFLSQFFSVELQENLLSFDTKDMLQDLGEANADLLLGLLKLRNNSLPQFSAAAVSADCFLSIGWKDEQALLLCRAHPLPACFITCHFQTGHGPPS